MTLQERVRMEVISLWSSYRRKIFPGEVTQQRRPQGHNLFRSGLGWLIILVLSVKHMALSIFLSPSAKMPSPEISIINDTIKSLARKNQVLFFRKLVRTSRETTESLHKWQKTYILRNPERSWESKFLFYLSLANVTEKKQEVKQLIQPYPNLKKKMFTCL